MLYFFHVFHVLFTVKIGTNYCLEKAGSPPRDHHNLNKIHLTAGMHICIKKNSYKKSAKNLMKIPQCLFSCYIRELL